MSHDITAESLLRNLEKELEKISSIAVAVSGGVDSMTLAVVSNKVNPATLMYHAVSPAVPVAATARVKHYAQLQGWNLQVIDAGEMEDPNYRANPVNRCYYCKTNLYSSLRQHLKSRNKSQVIISGTNTDDLEDYRPGLQAASEHQVNHPFVKAGVDKNGIRAIAQLLGLADLKDLPAAPCLSSRVTTGVIIDETLLPLIDEVESQIWERFGGLLNLTTVRCRIRPDTISIQLANGSDDIKNTLLRPGNIEQSIREVAYHCFQEYGLFKFTDVIVEGYVKSSAFVHAPNKETVQVISSMNTDG